MSRINLNINDDRIDEDDETIHVDGTTLHGLNVKHAVLTIVDNDKDTKFVQIDDRSPGPDFRLLRDPQRLIQ